MIYKLKSKGTIFIYILFCFFLNSCTRPEDSAIKVPTSDSTTIVPEKSGPGIYTVEIKDMKFQPEKINVTPGDTIIWINRDMVSHYVTEENTKTWASANIASGEWKMVLKASADYFCAVYQVIKGKIIVE